MFHAWEVPGGSFLELQASSQASRMGDNGCRGNRARVHKVRRSCTDPGIISKKAHGIHAGAYVTKPGGLEENSRMSVHTT